MARYEEPEFKTRMRISMDFNRAQAARVGAGNGLTTESLDALAPRVATAVRDFLSQRSRGDARFADLPYKRELTEASAEEGARLRDRFGSLIVLGGGSRFLGGRVLVEALAGDRVRFCDGVDPDVLGDLLESADPADTAFLVASRAGETAETLAPFWIVRERWIAAVGLEGYRESVVCLADSGAGQLRHVAERDGLRVQDLPGPEDGPFLALSAAGLIPAAAAGVDVHELMAGAAAIEQRCRGPDVWENPAAAFAVHAYSMHARLGKPILAVWPFTGRLQAWATWFTHLWASALGKRFDLEGKQVNAGSTAVAIAGVGEQHAPTQMCLEGPPDKFVMFVRVLAPDHHLQMPSFEDRVSQEVATYLGGRSLEQVVGAQCLATAMAMANEGRPSCLLDLPALNAYTLGGLIMFSQLVTAFAAGLYRVHPFDQPGLEDIRQLASALLGRPGLKDLAARAAGRAASEERFRF